MLSISKIFVGIAKEQKRISHPNLLFWKIVVDLCVDLFIFLSNFFLAFGPN